MPLLKAAIGYLALAVALSVCSSSTSTHQGSPSPTTSVSMTLAQSRRLGVDDLVPVFAVKGSDPDRFYVLLEWHEGELCRTCHQLLSLDPEDLSVTASRDLEDGARFVAVTAGGIAVSTGKNSVLILDPTTLRTTHTVSLNHDAVRLAVGPEDLYVAGERSERGYVSRVSLRTFAVEDTYRVQGHGPLFSIYDLAFDPERNRILIISGEGTITELDPTLALRRRIRERFLRGLHPSRDAVFAASTTRRSSPPYGPETISCWTPDFSSRCWETEPPGATSIDLLGQGLLVASDTGRERVVALGTETGNEIASVKVPAPDQVVWDPDHQQVLVVSPGTGRVYALAIRFL